MEYRNGGTQAWSVPETEHGFSLVVGGKTYSPAVGMGKLELSEQLAPGGQTPLVPRTGISLRGWRLAGGQRDPLVFQPGKWVMQIRCKVRQIEFDAAGQGSVKREIEVISNAVEIEVLP